MAHWQLAFLTERMKKNKVGRVRKGKRSQFGLPIKICYPSGTLLKPRELTKSRRNKLYKRSPRTPWHNLETQKQIGREMHSKPLNSPLCFVFTTAPVRVLAPRNTYVQDGSGNDDAGGAASLAGGRSQGGQPLRPRREVALTLGGRRSRSRCLLGLRLGKQRVQGESGVEHGQPVLCIRIVASGLVVQGIYKSKKGVGANLMTN